MTADPVPPNNADNTVASNRYRDAEGAFLKTIAAKRRVLGDEHPDTCISLLRLASMYTSQKRYQDAERAALAAYQGYTKHLGENHASTRAALEQLASLYAESGQPDKASVWRLKLK